jgi:hypothetical protein
MPRVRKRPKKGHTDSWGPQWHFNMGLLLQVECSTPPAEKRPWKWYLPQAFTPWISCLRAVDRLIQFLFNQKVGDRAV